MFFFPVFIAADVPAGELLLSRKSKTEIQVTWGIGSDPDNRPSGIYVVSLSPGDLVAFVNADDADRSVLFSGLDPATLYTIDLSQDGNSLSTLEVLTGKALFS